MAVRWHLPIENRVSGDTAFSSSRKMQIVDAIEGSILRSLFVVISTSFSPSVPISCDPLLWDCRQVDQKRGPLLPSVLLNMEPTGAYFLRLGPPSIPPAHFHCRLRSLRLLSSLRERLECATPWIVALHLKHPFSYSTLSLS